MKLKLIEYTTFRIRLTRRAPKHPQSYWRTLVNSLQSFIIQECCKALHTLCSKTQEFCLFLWTRITFLLSCWFSFSSSTNFRLLSLEVKEASLSSWIVFCKLWLSFSSFSMRLEAHSFNSNTKDFLAVETWESEGGSNQFTNMFFSSSLRFTFMKIIAVRSLSFQLDC